MGVFGAVFGCRGDAGFNGCCSGTRSGVVGFKVATLSRLVREKVPPARSKHPKIGVFTLDGRTFSRKCQWRGCVGRVLSRQSALRPGLVGDVAHEAGCRWGFCSIRNWLPACRRRVTPLMMPFPPFGGGEAATLGGVLAKLQTHWVKTAKNRWFWLNESALWRNRRLQAR